MNKYIDFKQEAQFLRDNAPPLHEIMRVVAEAQVEYETIAGELITGICLYRDKDIAVQKAFMPKGTEIKKHRHENELEILRVMSGKLQYFNGAKDGKILNAGDSIIINQNQRHSVIALEDTWVKGIIIPPAEGYPR